MRKKSIKSKTHLILFSLANIVVKYQSWEEAAKDRLNKDAMQFSIIYIVLYNVFHMTKKLKRTWLDNYLIQLCLIYVLLENLCKVESFHLSPLHWLGWGQYCFSRISNIFITLTFPSLVEVNLEYEIICFTCLSGQWWSSLFCRI